MARRLDSRWRGEPALSDWMNLSKRRIFFRRWRGLDQLWWLFQSPAVPDVWLYLAIAARVPGGPRSPRICPSKRTRPEEWRCLSQIFWHFPWFSQIFWHFPWFSQMFMAFSVDFPSCSVVPGGFLKARCETCRSCTFTEEALRGLPSHSWNFPMMREGITKITYHLVI